MVLDDLRVKILDAAIARDRPRLAPGHVQLDGKIVLVGTASDPLHLITVHPAGKKAMAAADWWRGRPTGSGTEAS
jgi:methionyl-tRNA formyltransferase